MLSGKFSPVAAATASVDKVSFYSRHSSSSSMADNITNQQPYTWDDSLKSKNTGNASVTYKKQSPNLASENKLHCDTFATNEDVREHNREKEDGYVAGKSHNSDDMYYEYESVCKTESSDLTTETTTSFHANDDDEDSRFV